MKKIIYIYVLDTMADWEIGYILQAISMQNMLKEVKYLVKTVGRTKETIKTLGGLTLTPDCTLEEINHDEKFLSTMIKLSSKKLLIYATLLSQGRGISYI